MANKKSQLDPAIRIRNNQRRARQRQKDLVEELRQRVAEYEQKGVQASLALQQSARWVAQENHSLRALLAAKGVTDEEVKAWLDKETGLVASEKRIKTCSSARVESNASKLSSTTSCTERKACGGGGRASEAPVARSYCSVKSEANKIVFKPPNGNDETQDRHDDSRIQPTTSEDHASATSCIEAAEMLVAIRGQDRDQVMLSLGCKTGTDCRIKNMELLEIMDS